MNSRRRAQALVTFEKKWPTSEDLRKKHPGLSYLLQGEFGSGSELEFIEHESGATGVSKPLMQSKIKNPRVGVILPGNYIFNNNDFTQTVIILEHGMSHVIASINSGKTNYGPTSRLCSYGAIIAPAGTSLHLTTKEPTFYFCQYTPIDIS